MCARRSCIAPACGGARGPFPCISASRSACSRGSTSWTDRPRRAVGRLTANDRPGATARGAGYRDSGSRTRTWREQAMADEKPTNDLAQQEREMEEHERKAQEHAADEASPEERRPAAPGAANPFPVQKSPGS